MSKPNFSAKDNELLLDILSYILAMLNQIYNKLEEVKRAIDDQ